jgi:hypothetical protein
MFTVGFPAKDFIKAADKKFPGAEEILFRIFGKLILLAYRVLVIRRKLKISKDNFLAVNIFLGVGLDSSSPD